MTAADFYETLRRNFGVRLGPAELAALVGTYDDDGNGVIDGGEFYRHFVKLGRVERARRKQQSKHEHEDRKQRALQMQNEAMKRFNAEIREAPIVWPEEKIGRRSRRSHESHNSAKKVVFPSDVKRTAPRRPKSAGALRPTKIVAL